MENALERWNIYSHKKIGSFAQPQKTKEQWLTEGINHYNGQRYEAAYKACEQAIRLDSHYVRAYHGKALALIGLKQYEKAIVFCSKTLQLTSNTSKVYTSKIYVSKGDALLALSSCKGALIAYEQAIQLNPGYSKAYNGKGNALYKLDGGV